MLGLVKLERLRMQTSRSAAPLRLSVFFVSWIFDVTSLACPFVPKVDGLLLAPPRTLIRLTQVLSYFAMMKASRQQDGRNFFIPSNAISLINAIYFADGAHHGAMAED